MVSGSESELAAEKLANRGGSERDGVASNVFLAGVPRKRVGVSSSDAGLPNGDFFFEMNPGMAGKRVGVASGDGLKRGCTDSPELPLEALPKICQGMLERRVGVISEGLLHPEMPRPSAEGLLIAWIGMLVLRVGVSFDERLKTENERVGPLGVESDESFETGTCVLCGEIAGIRPPPNMTGLVTGARLTEDSSTSGIIAMGERWDGEEKWRARARGLSGEWLCCPATVTRFCASVRPQKASLTTLIRLNRLDVRSGFGEVGAPTLSSAIFSSVRSLATRSWWCWIAGSASRTLGGECTINDASSLR